MTRILIPFLLLAAAVLPASALSEADLTPTALIGKTLTFTVETGAAPLATNGTWSGTFGDSPGNVFTKTLITGDSTSTNATWAFNGSTSGMYEYTIVHFLAGRPDGILTLWVSGGVGRYEVFLNGLFDNSQTGAFTIDGGTTTATGEITVFKPKGGALADGANFGFGSAKVDSRGVAKNFTIRNTGDAPLSDISIRKAGASKRDFFVSKPAETTLAAGASTTFKVTFRPSARGIRNAAIRLTGTGADTLTINLAGKGVR